MKTSEELGIVHEVHTALVDILRMMDTGELNHVEVRMTGTGEVIVGEGGNFNMQVWSCGTVGCIGGWVDKLTGNSASEDIPRELNNLYYPPSRFIYQNITVAQAAAALRNYLNEGAPQWERVMGEVA